jgi:hypothetical protein
MDHASRRAREVNKVSLWEGTCSCRARLHILHALHINGFVQVSEKDGDQLVDFYWTDPMVEGARCLHNQGLGSGSVEYDVTLLAQGGKLLAV